MNGQPSRPDTEFISANFGNAGGITSSVNSSATSVAQHSQIAAEPHLQPLSVPSVPTIPGYPGSEVPLDSVKTESEAGSKPSGYLGSVKLSQDAKRPGTSCSVCRKRKVKCDRNRPVCQNCVKYKVQHLCTYKDRNGKLVTEDERIRNENENLREEIAKLRKKLETSKISTANVQPLSEPNRPLFTGSAPHSSSSSISTFSATVNSNSPKQFLPNVTQHSWQPPNRGAQPGTPTATGNSGNSGNLGNSANPANSANSANSATPTFSARLSHTPHDPTLPLATKFQILEIVNGNLRSYGGTSHKSLFFNDVALHSLFTSITRGGASAKAQGLASGVDASTPQVCESQTKVVRMIEQALPDADCVFILLQAFFDSYYHLVPIIDQSLFQEELVRITKIVDNRIQLMIVRHADSVTLGLLLLFLRIGYVSLGVYLNAESDRTQWEEPTAQSEETRRRKLTLQFLKSRGTEVGAEYLEYMRLVMNTAKHHILASIPLMQLLLYVRVYLCIAPENELYDEDNAVIIQGLVTRLAVSMGLNRDPDNFPQIKDERLAYVWRTIWHVVCGYESEAVFQMGRPVFTEAYLCDTKAPTLLPENAGNRFAVEEARHLSVLCTCNKMVLNSMKLCLGLKHQSPSSALEKQCDQISDYLRTTVAPFEDLVMDSKRDSSVFQKLVRTRATIVRVQLLLHNYLVYYVLFLNCERQNYPTSVSGKYVKRALQAACEYLTVVDYSLRHGEQMFGEQFLSFLAPLFVKAATRPLQLFVSILVRSRSPTLNSTIPPLDELWDNAEADSGGKEKSGTEVSGAGLGFLLDRISDFYEVCQLLGSKYCFTMQFTSVLKIVLAEVANLKERVYPPTLPGNVSNIAGECRAYRASSVANVKNGSAVEERATARLAGLVADMDDGVSGNRSSGMEGSSGPEEQTSPSAYGAGKTPSSGSGQSSVKTFIDELDQQQFIPVDAGLGGGFADTHMGTPLPGEPELQRRVGGFADPGFSGGASVPISESVKTGINDIVTDWTSSSYWIDALQEVGVADQAADRDWLFRDPYLDLMFTDGETNLWDGV